MRKTLMLIRARSGRPSIQARSAGTANPATMVATTSPRMMTWVPGNGSPAKKPVAPPSRTRPSQAARATEATGGRRGELARVFAENKYDLVLAARGLGPLEHLAQELRDRHGVAARVVRADLSDPGAAARLWREAGGAEGRIDVLVNNAGVGLYGPLADQDPEAVTRMLQLNVVALSDLTRLALPGMLQRRAGGILNVASIVGYQPGGPRMAAYYASKAFVLSYSKGLAL